MVGSAVQLQQSTHMPHPRTQPCKYCPTIWPTVGYYKVLEMQWSDGTQLGNVVSQA